MQSDPRDASSHCHFLLLLPGNHGFITHYHQTGYPHVSLMASCFSSPHSLYPTKQLELTVKTQAGLISSGLRHPVAPTSQRQNLSQPRHHFTSQHLLFQTRTSSTGGEPQRGSPTWNMPNTNVPITLFSAPSRSPPPEADHVCLLLG